MAINAFEIAALQKNDQSDAGAFVGTECFDGMDFEHINKLQMQNYKSQINSKLQFLNIKTSFGFFILDLRNYLEFGALDL